MTPEHLWEKATLLYNQIDPNLISGFLLWILDVCKDYKKYFCFGQHLIYSDLYKDNSNPDINVRTYHCGHTNNYTHLNTI